MTAGPRALLLDHFGVLTGPVASSFAAYERASGIPEGRCYALLQRGSDGPGGGPIGAIERGDIDPATFEAELRTRLEADGVTPPAGSLLAGLFAGLTPAGPLWDLVRELRGSGVRTGVLTNSWGTEHYPWDAFDAHFDAVVVSAHVGLRKPDPAIFALACERLGVPPEAVVFVDDLAANVAAARAVGLVGVHHGGDDGVTLARVRAAFVPPR